MEFLSIPFTVFIVITILLYYAGKGKRWQHGLLLTASIIFIGYYHLQYLLYAIGITLFTFYAGKLLHKKKEDKSASWIFVGSLADTGRRYFRWAYPSIHSKPCRI
jgi:alginate O-acetyltransferase complex protein AlgI